MPKSGHLILPKSGHYCVPLTHQGKGIVSSSCARLIEYAFTDLGLNRVVMKIAEDNVPSRRVAERIGLAYEGTSRQSEWLYDHFVDQVIYAAVADQWLADRGIEQKKGNEAPKRPKASTTNAGRAASGCQALLLGWGANQR